MKSLTRIVIVIVLALMSCTGVYAQFQGDVYRQYNNTKVKHGSTEMNLAWSGGVNQPQLAMADLNRDGHRDIVYTCGDNGDGTRILKPYHGVYVFMNNGKDQFEQKYFYPMNGCYKVIARDFENRGVTDLAAIAYFTDPAHPDEWFAYLRNDGADSFTPFGPPTGTGFSSALTMDAGDFNGDRKPDLLVGSEFFSTQPQKKGSLFAILESTGNGN